jgi:integrase
MVITQAGLGLRIAELLALRVQDVDFLRRTVKVESQLTQNGLDRVDPKHQDQSAHCVAANCGAGLAGHIAEFPPAADRSLFTTDRGNLYRQEHYQARIFRLSIRAADSQRAPRLMTYGTTSRVCCSTLASP